MPLFLPYFLSLFYYFLSFSPFFLYSQFLIALLPWVVPSPLFGLSFSWVPLSGCLLLSYHGFSPLSASLHRVSLFQCFSLFPYFFLFHSVPYFSAVVTFLLQQTDSMRFLPFTPRASPTVFDLLWASFQDYPPTHWLPLPLLNTCLLHCYSFHDKIPFCLFLLYTSTSLPSSMACIR